MMIHTLGMNRVVQDLQWKNRQEFDSSGSAALLLPAQHGRDRLAGHYGQGGGLTYLVVRGAGHMVPVSRPGVAARILQLFTTRGEWGCS